MNEKNPLRLTWREVFDGFSMFPKPFSEIAELVNKTGYRYIAFNGIVRDLKGNEYCTVYDLVPR